MRNYNNIYNGYIQGSNYNFSFLRNYEKLRNYKLFMHNW